MLYLVATPIGNLSDISLRALEILANVDYILCEDTRKSIGLLKRHNLHKPLKSFHKFNEKSLEDKVVQDLFEGLNIALISDAGSPLISDPGEGLVARCQKEGLAINVIPGACSVIAALSLSGFNCIPFQFCGFLPKKLGELKTAFAGALSYSGTTVFFESPERLTKTLKAFLPLSENIKVAVVRELTKIYEECRIGTCQELLTYYTEHPPKGEIVLLLEPIPNLDPLQDEALAEKAVLKQIKEQKISLKEAIQFVAKTLKFDKKALYKKLGTK